MDGIILNYNDVALLDHEVPAIVRTSEHYSFYKDNIEDITEDVDLILLDMYGTIWNGGKFYTGALEKMQSLRERGKKIIIVSNTTALSEDEIKKNAKRGLIKGVHYDEFLTSGDICRDMLESNEIGDKFGHNYYVFGTLNGSLFKNLQGYKEVDDYNLADFIYIGVPQLTLEQRDSYISAKTEENSGSIFRESTLFKGKFDSIDIEPFREKLDIFLSLKKPIVAANNDPVSQEVDTKGKKNSVIRQGSLAKYYEDRGGRVISCGKPNGIIFEKAINLAKKKLSMNKLRLERILMVGDTLETDIFGGANAKIKTALCLFTGNMYNELSNLLKNYGYSAEEREFFVERLYREIIKIKGGIEPSFVIRSFSGELE